jgi:protein-tyrosine-phosphatase
MSSAALAQKWASDNKANAVVNRRAVNLSPENIVPEPEFNHLRATQSPDIATHRAARFDQGVVTFPDFILVMSGAHRDHILAEDPEAKAKVFLMAEYATGSGTKKIAFMTRPVERLG